MSSAAALVSVRAILEESHAVSTCLYHINTCTDARHGELDSNLLLLPLRHAPVSATC